MMLKKKLLYSIIFLKSFVFSQTFIGSTGTISDDGANNDFIIQVTGLPNQLDANLGLIQICLDITHTYNSDLNVHLISPDGTEINLFSGIGGGDDNFTNTCLSQTASQSINEVVAPFTGTYKPQEALGNVNNLQNPNGNWTLRIVDTYPVDIGILNALTLTFGANAATPFVFTSSNLPILILNTNNVSIPDEPKISGNMKIINNGFGAINYVTDTPTDYDGNIGIEMRGNYSQSLPQKPYAIETRDVLENPLDVSILGLPAEHDWCLLANYNDKVFMRNHLAYELSRKMGNYAARTVYCEVILNGKYQGVYLFTEKLKRDKNRIAISKLDTMENSGIDLTGGYILKNDYWNWDDSWKLNYHPIDHPELDVYLVYSYPEPENITNEQKNYIQTFINDFETSLYQNEFSDTLNGYRKYIHSQSFIDYFIINELSRNNDGFKKSSYFHKDKDTLNTLSKLKAGPVWDFDWAWKNINECSFLAVTDGSGWSHHVNDCGPDVNSPGWYIRLLQDSIFNRELKCRWNYLRANELSENYLFHYIDSIALYLNEAQARHFEKWGNLGINTGSPEVDADPATFEGQITRFKTWIQTRMNWLDANIPGNDLFCQYASLKENDFKNLKIVPNPASESFKIINLKNALNVQLYDVSGTLVLQENNVFQNEIKVQHLANGMYWCKMITSDNKIHLEKIIIAKE